MHLERKWAWLAMAGALSIIDAPSAPAEPAGALMLKPARGDWAISAGGFYMNLHLEFSRVQLHDQPVGGGYVAVEHYFAPWLAGELAVGMTPRVASHFSAQDLFLAGDEFRSSAHVQAITSMISGKFYPLRLRETKLRQFAFQPYLFGGVGAAFVPLIMEGSYEFAGDLALIHLEMTEAMGLFQAGAGLDAFLTRRLALFAEGGYLRSFAEPDLRIVLSPANADRRERLRMEAVQARVGLKFIF